MKFFKIWRVNAGIFVSIDTLINLSIKQYLLWGFLLLRLDHSVAQAGLEFTVIFLSQPPKC